VGLCMRTRGQAGKARLPATRERRPDNRLDGLAFEGTTPFDADERGFLSALVLQCAQALERARLYADERTARAQAETRERQDRLPFRYASRVARELARLRRDPAEHRPGCGGGSRRWCIIDLGSEGGAMQRLSVTHKDPESAPLARELCSNYPSIRSGRTASRRRSERVKPQLNSQDP